MEVKRLKLKLEILVVGTGDLYGCIKAVYIMKTDAFIRKYHFQGLRRLAIFNSLPNKPPILFEPNRDTHVPRFFFAFWE